MGPRQRLAARLRAVLGWADRHRDDADEVEHFLAEAEAELLARGTSPDEARRAVHLRYGDGLAARETLRRSGWAGFLDGAARDLRLGIRRLRRNPGFTALVVSTFALGIGAATAILSVVRPVFAPTPGYPEAERLVSIAMRAADGTGLPVAFGHYRELTLRSRELERLAVSRDWQPTWTGGAEAERLEGRRVTADYFGVLGVTPTLGPGFDPVHDRPGGAEEVVLSHPLWRDAFGADPAVVGRTIQLDGRSHTVVGVMPVAFHDAVAPGARIWTLLQYHPGAAGFEGREWGLHLALVARSRGAAGPEEARRELEVIAGRPLTELPRPGWAALEHGFQLDPLGKALTAEARPLMVVLVGAAGLLLLVTCANVSLLFLARSSRRRGEFAVSLALGAGRGRLVRSLLLESLLLALAGGALGIAAARAGVAILVAAAPPTLPHLEGIGLDPFTLGIALVLTTLAAAVVGLSPLLTGALGRGERALREAGRGSVAGGGGARRALVVSEVALAVILLVGAGLLLRTTRALFDTPPGFVPSGLVVLQVHATGIEGGDGDVHSFFERALDAVRGIPGVSQAGWTSQLPLSGEMEQYGIRLAEADGPEGPAGGAYRHAASPGYLETMGIPLLAGRMLQEGDAVGGPPGAVVSERLARRLFPHRDPLGARFHLGGDDGEPWTIVGVVGDVKQQSLEADAGEAVYLTPASWRWADRVRWLVVRVEEGEPTTLLPALRGAIRGVDPDRPVVRAQTMATLVSRSEARRRLVLLVLSAFAASALILAAIGLYGVVAGSVAERRREIGVRVALGASRERIVRLVVRQGMVLTGVGIGIGMVAMLLVSDLLTSFLYGVSRVDPLTYGAVAILLALVSLGACWLPAARAARVDPLVSLRSD